MRFELGSELIYGSTIHLSFQTRDDSAGDFLEAFGADVIETGGDFYGMSYDEAFNRLSEKGYIEIELENLTQE